MTIQTFLRQCVALECVAGSLGATTAQHNIKSGMAKVDQCNNIFLQARENYYKDVTCKLRPDYDEKIKQLKRACEQLQDTIAEYLQDLKVMNGETVHIPQ